MKVTQFSNKFMSLKSSFNRKRQTWRRLSGATATLLIASLFLAAPVYAAGTPLCASSGSGLCLSDHGSTGSGSGVFYEGGNSGPNQNITTPLQTSTCNGHVSGSGECPFTAGSGLNSTYNGDKIVHILFSETGVCAADTDLNSSVYVDACNANGTNWVVSGDKYVNVYSSDHSGPSAVCLASPLGGAGNVAEQDYVFDDNCADLAH